MAHATLRVVPHLSYAEITQRYKTAASNRQQRYWQLIRLMAHPTQPKRVAEAAEAAGFRPCWARQLVHRYNTKGPEGFYDQRKHNPGQDALLTPAQQQKLKDAIMSGVAPDQGLWTGQKVAAWIAQTTGKAVRSETTGLNYLHKLGFTVQMPRPRHIHAASPAEVKTFKKSSGVQSWGSNVIFQTEW